MAEVAELVAMLKQTQEDNRQLMQMLMEGRNEPKALPTVSIPNFPAFDSTLELWTTTGLGLKLL